MGLLAILKHLFGSCERRPVDAASTVATSTQEVTRQTMPVPVPSQAVVKPEDDTEKTWPEVAIPAGAPERPLVATQVAGQGNVLPNGRYLVRFGSEKVVDDAILVQFIIAVGPQRGKKLAIWLNNRKARAAIQERSGGWVDWLQFEGDPKGTAISYARDQGVDGQFLVNVKNGLVTSIPDPSDHGEIIDRLIREEQRDRLPTNSATPLEERDRQKYFEEYGRDKGLIDLAVKFRIPLDICRRDKAEVLENAIPTGWDDVTLLCKRSGGRKVIRLDLNEIEGVSICDEELFDGELDIEGFANALKTGSNPAHRSLAATLLLRAIGSDAAWPTILELSDDPSPEVRGSIADDCRTLTIRVRKTVMKTGYTMLEPNPPVLLLLLKLAKDHHSGVRTKACYALGDQPDPASKEVLEALGNHDSAHEVQKAARSALERLVGFEKVRMDYEAAQAEKQARPKQIETV